MHCCRIVNGIKNKNKMIKWFLEKRLYQSPKTILHGRDAILRVRDKWLIFNIILQLWADVKYHVPTGFGFSPKASGFYPFDDATALAGESGVGDVAWLIQASASNHKPKGRFFWYAFGIYKPKEPSLWFERTVPLVCGLCAIVYCKNNQGCGLISTALILYDFIGIICGAWWRCVLRLSVCCARLRHGVPNCHACHVADGVKPCRLRSRCAGDPSCSQPFAAIAIAG